MIEYKLVVSHLKFLFARQRKSALEKLKQFSTILTKLISLNSVSKSTNEIHFPCQTVKTILKVKTVSKRLKIPKIKTDLKRAELLYFRFFRGLFITFFAYAT